MAVFLVVGRNGRPFLKVFNLKALATHYLPGLCFLYIMATKDKTRRTFYEDLTHEQKQYVHAHHNKTFVKNIATHLGLEPFRISRYMNKAGLASYNPIKLRLEAMQNSTGQFFDVDAVCSVRGAKGEYSWIA